METTKIRTWLLDNGFDTNSLLLNNQSDIPALILAAQQNRLDVLNYLLDLGADLTVLDVYGNNALWAACFSEAADCISALLKAGINIDHQNPSGATALIYASSSGKHLIVSQLLQAGANPLLTTQDDFSAIHLAATRSCLQLLRQALKT